MAVSRTKGRCCCMMKAGKLPLNTTGMHSACPLLLSFSYSFLNPFLPICSIWRAVRIRASTWGSSLKGGHPEVGVFIIEATSERRIEGRTISLQTSNT